MNTFESVTKTFCKHNTSKVCNKFLNYVVMISWLDIIC